MGNKKAASPSSRVPSAASIDVAQDKLAQLPPIVALGASAGGLQAYQQFFQGTPPDSGMAFVLVSHLDPEHPSLLAELLQKVTSMPVKEAVHDERVQPNCVYVIPPKRDMTVFNGRLLLGVPDRPHAQRLPIDEFFRSLAEDQGERAVGVVLSGTGTDGTEGLRAIHGAGGLALVQDPANADFDGMPRSAVASGHVDQVLTLAEMPRAVMSAQKLLAQRKDEPLSPSEMNGVTRILMQLRSVTGHDFSQYKKSTILRRIERRMSQHGIEDKEVYARFLREHPNEVTVLFKELLINVTSFFRDPLAFDVMRQDVLPLLFKDRPAGDTFRAWVAGCASGEEAYSIAMVLREWMSETGREFKVQVYSTDLDDDAIAVARLGLYPPSIVQDVSAERLERFFSLEEGGYRIKTEIREMVIFATQNVIKDPPFTKLDLLSCRNLMIYLEPDLQSRLIATFHYSLRPGGVLFLSPSESIGNHTELFSVMHRKWKFYQARATSATPRIMMTSPLRWNDENNQKHQEETMSRPKEASFAELSRRALLQCFAPVSVTTDLRGETLYVHGETGKYLQPAPGQPSLNIMEMARDGLELELRAAIHAAATRNTPTLNRSVQVKTEAGVASVLLSVRLIPKPRGDEPLLLISFQDLPSPAPVKAGSRRRSASSPGELSRIEELEHQLAYTRQNLQVTIEEQQASNEELKSANEELQSTNEELQSSNEELETSKEELQSVNEELITVNAELQAKIEQLAGMQNDMKNLLDNISIGTVFLDEHMVIRRFTREATRVYRLVASDVGRPLADIKSNLARGDLMAEAQAVLESLVPYESEVCTQTGTWYLVRIQPYRTLDNVIEGVVLTFTDISQRIRAEAAGQQARLLAENIVDTVREPLLVLDAELHVQSANRAFYSMFKTAAGDTVGKCIYDLGNRQWDSPALRQLLEDILPRDQIMEHYRVTHDFPIIGKRTLTLNARKIIGETGAPALILLAMEEAT